MPFHLIKWGLSLEGIKLTRFTLLFSAQGKFSIFMGFVALTLCSAQPLLATPAPTVALLALPSISETFLKSFILLCVVLRRRNMNSNRWSQILWLPTPLLQCFSTMLTVLSSLRLIVTFHYDLWYIQLLTTSFWDTFCLSGRFQLFWGPPQYVAFCEWVEVLFGISSCSHSFSQTPSWVQDSLFSKLPPNGQFISSSVVVAFWAQHLH